MRLPWYLLLMMLGFASLSWGKEPTLKQREAHWAPKNVEARYEELRSRFAIHPVTRRLLPAEKVNAWILFGTVTNFVGGRVIQVDSNFGLVAVYMDQNF